MKNSSFLSKLIPFFAIVLVETVLHFLLLVLFRKMLYPESDLLRANPLTGDNNLHVALEAVLSILLLRLLFFELVLKLFFELMMDEKKRLFMQLTASLLFLLVFSIFTRSLDLSYDSLLSSQFFPLFVAMLIVFLFRFCRLMIINRQSQD